MISPMADIIEDAKQGRMFILADAETRENEGDLIIPAECVTPEAIAFMAREGRGLICLALGGVLVDKLGLPLIGDGAKFGTAFTTPIGARRGVTTGISAADRAATVRAALGGNRDDIVTPGHVFPLRAKDGGVLERPGHTEAAVDIAKLAGHAPAGVICEIMNDDGTMARMPELAVFAKKHGLKIGTIGDLIAYRRKKEAA